MLKELNIKRIKEVKFGKMLIFMLIARIPYLIVFYPGLMIYDTGCSLEQFYGFSTSAIMFSSNQTASLTNHHMILLTYLFGGFVKFGEMLGSQNFGFFIFIICQVFLANLVIVYSLKLLKNKVSNIAYCLIFLFYSVFPLISIWQITMGKDSLFAIFIMLLVLLLFKAVDSDCKTIKSVKYNLIFFVCSLFIVFTKQQGSYILIIMAIVMLLKYKKKAIGLFLNMTIPAIFYLFVFVGMILPANNVASSGKQETMGFMFQQTALAIIEHEDSITNEEKEITSKVLPYENIKDLYNPNVQDSLKFTYNQQSSIEENRDYYEIWLKMFFKYPISYVKATFFNMEHFMFEGNSLRFMPQLLKENELLTEKGITFNLYNSNPLSNYFKVAIYLFARLPILGSMCKSPFYVFTNITLSMLILLKNIKYSVLCIPSILCVTVLIITPLEDFRYILPLVYMMPLLFGIYKTRKV